MLRFTRCNSRSRARNISPAWRTGTTRSTCTAARWSWREWWGSGRDAPVRRYTQSLPMPKVKVIKVPLTAPAKDALDKLTDEEGMTQLTVLNRLVEWFAKEDLSVQYMILGLCPPDCTAEVATLLL